VHPDFKNKVRNSSYGDVFITSFMEKVAYLRLIASHDGVVITSGTEEV
jgi:hypothetical protein